ncbi:hypothetical protein V1478_006716, partial [Vespula squamosa]
MGSNLYKETWSEDVSEGEGGGEVVEVG